MNNDVSILIVEDEIITVNFIKNGLEKYGYNNITYCLTSEQALVQAEESKLNLILLDISLEERYSGIELAKIFTESFHIPVIFITGGTDEQTIAKIEESEPYGLLFKPFRIQTLKVLISIAIKRMQLEQKKLESERNLELSKLKLLDRVRELDTFFKISQLLNKISTVDDLILKALPLVASAFNMSEFICTRITYNGRIYESENFKESKWVLSESLSKKYKKGDLIELYLIVEDSIESFPFSIDDINTFSAITQQLSLALERFTFQDDLNNQLHLREMLNTILQNLIVKSDVNLSSLFKSILKRIGTSFNSDFCQIVIWKKNSKKNLYSLTTWTSDKTIKPGLISTSILEDLRFQKKTMYFSAQETSGVEISKKFEKFLQTNPDTNYLVIPILKDLKQLGFLWISLKGIRPFIRDNINGFNIIGDIILLAITKFQRERKIQVYRQAIEQNPSTIIITDLDGKINYVNPMFTKTTGYSFKEAVGQDLRDLKSGLKQDDYYFEMWDQLGLGNTWRSTFQNKCKDGRYVWELTSISPIKNISKEITGYISIIEDISEKVKAETELKKLNSELIQTQSSLVQEEKLASIGRLAAGVAHEINNPIGFVYSNFRTMGKYKENFQVMVDSLLSDKTLDQNYLEKIIKENKIDFILEDMDELLKESYDGFDRVINIVNSLRSFSRVDQLKAVVPYDLNESIKTTLIIARNEIKYVAEIKTEYSKIPKTMCNSSEINQVILNLLVNAAQAIKLKDNNTKGFISIKTYRDADYICCSIMDSGPGIPENVIGNIFEPFFTTKPVGEGTGLGLNISYDIIVKKHKGQLYAENDKTYGAVFTFKLPVIKESPGEKSNE